MNEAGGQKGDHNDHRRTLIISKKNLKKLKEHQKEEELKDLENKVKKQQIKTFVTVAPIIVTGVVLKTFSGTSHKEATSPLILPKTSTENYKKQAFLTTDNHNNIIEVEIKTSEYTKERVNINTTNLEKLIENNKPKRKTSTPPVEVIEIDQTKIPIKETTIEDVTDLNKLKNKEIISQYEEKLKRARKDLKDLIYEYEVIETTYKNTKDIKELEELLERLNTIIKKITDLKEKISLSLTNNYDATYIKELASTYIESFENKELINEIKDSSLYILISTKITELEIQKELLNLKLEDRKKELEIDEAAISDLKVKYDDYQNFNLELLKLQAEQDAIVRDLKEKIANSVTVTERVEVTTRFLNHQVRSLRRLLSPQTLIPGPRSARRMSVATASYLRFMRNVLRPRREIHHYRVFEVTDYSKEIEYSISELDKGLVLLKKSSQELKHMIANFEKDYQEYLDNKEVQELLSNLESIYSSLKEKEEDLLRIKKEQEKNLEETNKKVVYEKRYEQIDQL